ncbi:BTAD domain-containing putative transcriptional regulator [Kitasatospora sp. NPDC056181]|uniref:BTAD domain-containing putative transcriptional regulator n=1 Tax=Kitasatospora sp. NPDC056181 TaxID=3345737 RepID=UPI0035DC6D46
MHVGILGPLEVSIDGRIVRIGGARLRTVLVRLALDAGRVVSVDSLATALWPDGGPTGPGHALHSLLSRLRTTLQGHPALRYESGGYLLDLPPEAVDALQFTQLAREGRRLLREGHPQGAAGRLREALGLWRGQALSDVAAAPFAAAAAAGLDELRLSAREDALQAELETSPDRLYIVAELSRLVAEHPLRERLRVLLVTALGADGRQAEALTAFEEYRKLLAEELGTDPGQQLQEAHLAVLRGSPAPLRRTTTHVTGNLRAPISSFIGRIGERAHVAARLRDGRLVTLVGPGGVGKTRLATTVATEALPRLPGGAWLVELAPVTDPADLLRSVLDTLGLREGGLLDGRPPSHDPIDTLVEAFSSTEAIIVLDNCEHLLDATARFTAELLGRCPRLRILATSREPLGLPGEILCRVPPLELPEPRTPAILATASAAVRLFADRAAAVRPGFTVDDDNAAAVVEICRRLDGLPLAIELAAARLRAVPVEQLAGRLDDRFGLIIGGSRIELPRHQTLRGVVAWSWDLLDRSERALTELLAVFPGEIALEDAEGIHARAGSSPEPLLDHLSVLVDKSLLQLVDGPHARYRMLETIREYGLEQLADSGRLESAGQHHAAYFLELAEHAAPDLRGPDQLRWIARLGAERDNLRAALHHAADTGDADTATRLAAALGPFWTIRGDHAQAVKLLGLALGAPGAHPTTARAVATAFLLFNRVLSGDLAHPAPAVAEALELARTVDGSAAYPTAALIEASLALTADDADRGLAAIDRDLSRCDPWGRGMLLLMRAFLQGNHGDLRGTGETLLAAAAAFREAGERWGLALSLTALAHTDSTLGAFDRAIAELQEAIRLLREIDPADDAIIQRAALAVARTRKGDTERARAELLDMVRPSHGLSSPRHLLSARIALGDLARQADDLAEAARHYAEASTDLAHLPTGGPLFNAMLHTSLGHLAVATGDPATAAQRLSEALALASGVPDMPVAAAVGVGVARLRLAGGDAEASAEVLGAAHTLRGAPDRHDPDVIQLVRALEHQLGNRAYDSAYRRGRERSRTSALGSIRAALTTGH